MDALSDLRLFSEIVNRGSFVEAAEHLDMTPSGVSKRLSRFEDRLQVRLFNRTTRSLALTEPGQELFQRARLILDAIDEAESYTRALSKTPSGKIRVASSDAFALHVIVPMLEELNITYPELSVILVQGDGPLDLVAEKVDLAIRFEKPVHASFVAKRLIADPWIVCASPNYIGRFGKPEEPTQLLAHRCLTIEARQSESNRWEFSDGKETEHITIDSVFSGIGLVVKEAAVAGLGVARLANFLVKDEIRAGRLVPLLESHMPPSDRSIYAVYPNREFLPIKVRVFIDALHQALTRGDSSPDDN